ncbi:NADP-dependent isocitrate dehydrogenase [Nocardia brasiliensis ATCC 700358]|uniref:NADP-dependent isocitrate dehydrogenase n=1 Tax=Nocardia brasiliensis (strain ATCC 700358 / HUJEG-1) TaxID=1133849 RepID=K0EQ96_NOCB7|nr:NADP-dependent isocitrate dehydrogenase [Nocardia brasiliensis ATCC 700358]
MLEPARPGEDRRDRVGRGRLALLVLAVVPGDGAVRGLRLTGLAVRGQQHRRHQAERTEALGHGVGLHIAVVVLTGPDVTALPLHGGGDHVVDEAVLVGQARRVELGLELGVEDILERVLEHAVVGLEDGVLRGQIHRVVLLQAVVERGAREIDDRVLEVVHAHDDAAVLGHLHDLVLDRLAAVLRREGHGDRARLIHLEIGGAVLVAERVAADDDRLGPAGHQARDVGDDDRGAEDGAAEDVADGAVGRAPHLLQAEFLDAGLVRRDGGAFDADAVALDRLGGIDGDLVVCLVPVLDAQVVVLEVHVEIRMDQLVLDELPDDPGHLVAVEFDDGAFNLDLGHGSSCPPRMVPSLHGQANTLVSGPQLFQQTTYMPRVVRETCGANKTSVLLPLFAVCGQPPE